MATVEDKKMFVQSVQADPTREPEECDTLIHTNKAADGAIIESHSPSVIRSLLKNPEFTPEEASVLVSGTAGVRRKSWEDVRDDQLIVAIKGEIPKSVLKIKATPRKRNIDSQIVGFPRE